MPRMTHRSAPRLSLAVLLGLVALPAAAQIPPPVQGLTTPAPQAVVPPVNPTQRGVPAEATAENGVLARDKALASGRRAAWQRLLAEAGVSGPTLSDSQIEDMVSSIVIEEERTSPTRYAGRITVNFNPTRVRRALGGRATAGMAGQAPGVPGAPAAAPEGPAPISNYIEVIATYASMAEWTEITRRLRTAGPIGSVAIQAMATDAARLRLGLRATPQAVAGRMAAAGLAMGPAPDQAPGDLWRVGLAGGG